jgi:hypothetical protein
MNIYTLLEKLVDNLPSDQDKKAGTEVIQQLKTICAFGYAAESIKSETDETIHTHVKMSEVDVFHPGKLHDICGICGTELRSAYDPDYSQVGYADLKYRKKWW